jgi:hypothetical protein
MFLEGKKTNCYLQQHYEEGQEVEEIHLCEKIEVERICISRKSRLLHLCLQTQNVPETQQKHW